MNTDTHEFWQEIYPADDRELKPPKSVKRATYDGSHRYEHTEKLEGPWTFVSVTAIAGHANGLFHGGKPSHVVVVWAREKKR